MLTGCLPWKFLRAILINIFRWLMLRCTTKYNLVPRVKPRSAITAFARASARMASSPNKKSILWFRKVVTWACPHQPSWTANSASLLQWPLSCSRLSFACCIFPASGIKTPRQSSFTRGLCRCVACVPHLHHWPPLPAKSQVQVSLHGLLRFKSSGMLRSHMFAVWFTSKHRVGVNRYQFLLESLSDLDARYWLR